MQTLREQAQTKTGSLVERAKAIVSQYESPARVEFLARVRPDELLRQFESFQATRGLTAVRAE